MIYIIDFNDSFTWNIARSLQQIGLTCEVLNFQDKNLLKKISKREKTTRAVVILGPGPGHPEEYFHVQKWITKWLQDKNIFTAGICLGHQLIALHFGFLISTLKQPKHGKQWRINLRNGKDFLGRRTLVVQSYNSLGVIMPKNKPRLGRLKCLLVEGYVESMRWERGMSVQFHPESVGTTCPEVFFNPIKDFLYNGQDDAFDPI
jgi:anthranilate/para-aminobenzoate synthase component II